MYNICKIRVHAIGHDTGRLTLPNILCGAMLSISRPRQILKSLIGVTEREIICKARPKRRLAKISSDKLRSVFYKKTSPTVPVHTWN